MRYFRCIATYLDEAYTLEHNIIKANNTIEIYRLFSSRYHEELI